ncbi:uncharacterized protein C683.02c-like [Vicia villosa]|uniref:uncharacterized protein C683.02c-like n=1 Tax=Vicia villosa TaxID=3911 RepID=UPI00273B22F7|nr:uncharacterized protein C683.02c-like [Vicia villosa]
MRHDIKKAIGYQQITHFSELVNKSRIYDEDNRESASHYKSSNDGKGKGKGQCRGKLYDNKKKRKIGYDGKPSGEGANTLIKCFKCAVEGHCACECNKDFGKCFKCGKRGHKAVDCRVGAGVTCYNCGEQGHISTKCDKSKKEQAKGKVFAFSGFETTTEDRLIRVTRFINGTPFIAIIDISVTQYLICVKVWLLLLLRWIVL